MLSAPLSVILNVCKWACFKWWIARVYFKDKKNT